MKFTCDSGSIDEQVNCNCFSPCDEVTYDADIIISNYQKDEIEKTKTEKYDEVIITCLQISVTLIFSDSVNAIYVVFKETKFMTLLRSERYGFIDFISNCGGLMGLFMGISILSIVEIFYYTAAFVKHLIFKLCFRNNRVYDDSN
jgi:amiloride-sensitive sodium channel